MTKRIVFSESTSGSLVEKDGTYEVTLLTPGQGTSAFYSESLIKRDAPSAFPKGTHIYLDHLQEGEARSTKNLVGFLVEDTTIRESDGSAINRLKPFKHWAEFVEEVREHVALSINARGNAQERMVEGQKVLMAESIEPSLLNTVDIVARGGRPGSGFNESLLQDALNHEEDEKNQTDPSASGNQEEGNKMELEEATVTALATAISEKIGAILTEALTPKPAEKDDDADRLATVEAIQVIESAEVPASVKTRLVESVKDGSAKVDAIKAEITSITALREELKTELANTGLLEHRIIGARGNAGGNEAPVVSAWGNK